MFHPWKCDNDPEENVLGRVSTTHIHQPDFFWPRFLTFGPVTLSPRSWRTCGRFEALAVSLSGWCDGSDLWTHTQVGALLRMSWTCKVWIWRVNPDPMLFSRFLFGRLQGPPYLIFMILVPFWLQKVKIRKQNQTFRQQDPLQGHSAPKVPKHPGRTRRAAFLCGGCRWDAQMLLGLFGAALQVCKVQMKVEASGSHDHDLAVKSCAAFLCSVVFLRAVHPDAFGVAVEKKCRNHRPGSHEVRLQYSGALPTFLMVGPDLKPSWVWHAQSCGCSANLSWEHYRVTLGTLWTCPCLTWGINLPSVSRL